ncbi:hypothetical protein [Pseudomonas fluorescens]|uniref:Uncharacterized protein n=1 Tax=Pseudomonas fluorescens TaxID=294 RepID=A0A0F4TVK1_PSEFL|nr:hypothetical protein [Pseudomonas fluorescens]KJZ48483.1 hypothetical protein VC34_01925 [Pseudomonas fluorescens]
METSIVIDGVSYVFVTADGVTELKVEAETTASEDIEPKSVHLPNIWLVTRGNGTPLFGLKPALCDKPFRIMSAEKLYAEKAQWFEPLADYYRELVWVNPESSQAGTDAFVAYKHFTWQEIIEYAIVDRPSAAYGKQSYADWKVRDAGGSGYLMVFIADKPYWTDGIGQIPFAVDTFRLYWEKELVEDIAIEKTIVTGIEYGDGSLFGAKADYNNEYDNFIILRATLWASKNFHLEVVKHSASPIRSTAAEMTTTSTTYSPVSTLLLETPISQALLDQYGIWNKQVAQ